MHVYIYIYVCMCMCIYIYIYERVVRLCGGEASQMFPVMEQNRSQPFHRLRRHIGSAMSLKLPEIPNTQ